MLWVLGAAEPVSCTGFRAERLGRSAKGNRSLWSLGRGLLRGQNLKGTGRSSGQPSVGLPGTRERTLPSRCRLLACPLHRAPPYPGPIALPRLRASRGGIQLFSPEMKLAEVQIDQNAQPPLFLSSRYSSKPGKASRAGDPQGPQHELPASLPTPRLHTPGNRATPTGQGPAPSQPQGWPAEAGEAGVGPEGRAG